MTSVFLSCYNLPVIKQVAEVLGWIMNLLYKFFSIFGIYNIGLCILLFTIIVKMILLPMTIKQQRFTKLSAVMNPEIQAVQKKYKDKRDQESMMKMNQEMSAIYEKYGTSPTGGCLTLLIQMPILLALYGVVSQIPVFIDEVGNYFDDAGAYISESVDYFYDINKLDELSGGDKDGKLDEIEDAYYEKSDDSIDKEKTAENISNAFSGIAVSPDAIFTQIFGAYDEADEIIEKLSAMSADDWAELLENNKEDEKLITEYSEMSADDWTSIKSSIDSNRSSIDEIKENVDNSYDFIGINLSQSPSAAGNVWSILIPLLAAATQFLSVKVANKFNSSQTGMTDNPMGSSMKMMTYTMPIMSAIFCYTLPAGLGVYWIMSAVVQTVQSIFIGKYFVNVDVNDIIKSNVEKANKKRAKQGLPPKKITTAATSNVKNIKVEESKPTEGKANTNNNSTSQTKGKGGIAAKANIVSKYNKK
ncbi:MAG: YidC/Oxa1 family membrane protein insertase [Lachnospiraceae bacterium]